MAKQNGKQIDFEGKDFFIGMDVDKGSWKLCVRCADLELKRESIDPRPEVLKRYLDRRYPGGRYHTVYEAGYAGFWIHRQLLDMEIDSIVVNAADVPTSHKEHDRKTDTVDARKLARELEKNNLKGIHIPSEADQHLRSLARHLRRSVQSTTRVKNRIRAHLAFSGIMVPEDHVGWSNNFVQWLEELDLDNGPGRDSLGYYVEELFEHRQRTGAILKSLKQACKKRGDTDLIKCLCSVPGIAFRTAMVLYTEIMDMTRFSNFDKLKTFAGLIPSKNQSGKVDKDRGITKRRNRYVRHCLIESAWVAIRMDPAMLAYYNKQLRRMKKQEAIIRVAKKLLSRIRKVWLSGIPYECSIK